MNRHVIAGLIDYGAGNLKSVSNTLHALGYAPVIVRQPEDLDGVTHLILPGVGAYGDCSRKLADQSLKGAIHSWIHADKPFLGICVGYQILFQEGEETPGINGLGEFSGKVVKFPMTDMKVPHMGWNSVRIKDVTHPIWKGIEDNSYFYFVHSYFPVPEDASIVAATCVYGVSFAAAIARGNLIATQFHPEKSQILGLKLISNFLSL